MKKYSKQDLIDMSLQEFLRLEESGELDLIFLDWLESEYNKEE